VDAGDPSTTVDDPRVIGTVNAAGNLAEGVVWDGQGADFTNNCDGDKGWIQSDYSASDGSGNGVQAQVCWNGDPGDAVTVGGTTCPTDVDSSLVGPITVP